MTKFTILTVSALALGAAALAVPTGALADAKGWGRHGGDRMERMQGMRDGQMQPRFDFAAADADGDGKVTQDELSALRAAEIAALDADGDGFISVEEMTERMVRGMKERLAIRAERQIGNMDSDGDGKLAVTELPDLPLGNRLFAAIDADADGAITEEEIAEARGMFAKLRGMGEGRGEGQGRWMRGHN